MKKTIIALFLMAVSMSSQAESEYKIRERENGELIKALPVGTKLTFQKDIELTLEEYSHNGRQELLHYNLLKRDDDNIDAYCEVFIGYNGQAEREKKLNKRMYIKAGTIAKVTDVYRLGTGNRSHILFNTKTHYGYISCATENHTRSLNYANPESLLISIKQFMGGVPSPSEALDRISVNVDE